MDEKVKEIIDKVKASAVSAGEYVGVKAQQAGKRAGEMMEVTKLNLQVFDLNNEISLLYRQLGEILYSAHVDPATDDTLVAEKLAEIDGKHARIASLKERIEEYKQTQKCKNPECGRLCGKDDTYCPRCGAEL